MKSIACSYCGKAFTPREAKNQCCSTECAGAKRRSMSPEALESKLFRHREIIDGTGCWEWTAGRSSQGYGVTSVNYRQYIVSRVSAHLYLGLDLLSPLFVCHKCDNPPCFNPDHLFIGDSKDNARDMVEKHRDNPPSGKRNGMSVLNDSEVMEIRKLESSGISWADISICYDITEGYVGHIVAGVSWKHLPLARAVKKHISEDEVREIRSLYESGVGQVEIGRRYDLGRRYVSRICARHAWAKVQ